MGKKLKIAGAIAGGLLVAGIIGGIASSNSGNNTPTAVSTQQPSHNPTFTMMTDPNGQKCDVASMDNQGYCPGDSPAPTPSPDGTFQGACDYTLGSDPVNGTAVATGDVTVTNTGNIGTIDKVSISWPQQGYSPLTMTKTVRVPVGGENDVQFHMPLTSTQLDNLQNWQMGHTSDGCKYNASIIGTFGSVSG